jgi:hypothetical protein
MTMIFDISKFPVNQLDEQLKDETGKLVNFKQTIIKALMADVDEAGNALRNAEQKFKRFDLYMKFKNAKDKIELDAKEVVTITEACVGGFPSFIAGQVKAHLAVPEAQPEAPKE